MRHDLWLWTLGSRLRYARRWLEQRAFETGPAGGLGVFLASQRFENLDPGVLPLELGPIPAVVAAPVLGRLDRPPRFFNAAGGKQAPRDVGGDLRRFPGFFLVLIDEGVDVAL